MAAKKAPSTAKRKTANKKNASNDKKPDNFLEQTIASIEDRARKEIEDIRERIEGGLEEATNRANQRSSKLEEAFDKRVAQAYNRMGLPSKADIIVLEAKIDELQKTVETLSAGAAEPASKKTSTKKSTRKKASPPRTKKV
ncbi:MAG: phasin family protein [Pseudomonadales bacterium]